MSRERLAQLVEDAVNAYFDFDPDLRDEMAKLHGKCIGFDITTFDQRLYFSPKEDGRLAVSSECQSEADTLIKARAIDLFHLALEIEDVDAKAEISGDVNLGKKFQRIFADIDFDWEELLVPWLGDGLANEAGKAVRRLKETLREGREGMAESVHEYLLNETELAVSKSEVDEFINGVDELRDAIDRIDSRLRSKT